MRITSVKLKSKKGSSIVEFLVVIPVMIFFLVATWQVFQLNVRKNSLINAVRYMVWEKIDYTGGDYSSNPRATSDIVDDVKDMYSFEDDKFSYTLQDNASVSLGDFGSIGSINDLGSFTAGLMSVLEGAADVLIWTSIDNLGLNKKGFWKATASYEVDTPGSMLNSLIPSSEEIQESYVLTEKCALLTDSWFTPDPKDNDATKGVSYGGVRERLKGYWLAGPVPLAGTVSSVLSEVLEFEINLGFLGTYPLCEEQPPRVNLQSVPDRI